MIEINKIYNCPYQEKINLIDDKSIKCIVTSPPYNLGGDFHTFVNGKRVTYGDYDIYKDKMSESDYKNSQIDLLNECHRIVSDDGFMFYNHKNRIIKGSISSPLEWIYKTDWNIYQIVVLDFSATANVDKRRFFPVHELLFVLNKSNKVKLKNEMCLTDVWKMKKVSRKTSGHPAVFHEDLPTNCILASTNEGDIVLDMHSGTGTTCYSAKKLNRKYIGFEISEEYYNKSIERINTI